MLVCEVEDLHADAVAVEALARLQLTARRMRCSLQLSRVREELRELIELVGLRDVLPSFDSERRPPPLEER